MEDLEGTALAPVWPGSKFGGDLGVWDPMRWKNASPRPKGGRRKAEKKLIIEA
jgi:hypothetical protein